MAQTEADIAQEIARLEAELEKARLETQLRSLKAELAAVENSGQASDDYMVIEDLADGEESYEEYTDGSYEEYEEEEYVEDEISYEEESYTAEEEQDYDVVIDDTMAPEQAPVRAVFNDIRSAQGNLRKAPGSILHQQVAAETAKEPPVSAPSSLATTAPVEKTVRKPKGEVRPPPEHGGTPLPREDPEVKPKPKRKNPLSRLLQRNEKSSPAMPVNTSANATSIQAAASTSNTQAAERSKKRIVRKTVVKKKQAPTDQSSGVPASGKPAAKPKAGGPIQRRIIPNLQPSPEGQESIFEQLLGPKLITNPNLHKCSTKGCVKDQDLVCLYFAASWKSECKSFLPMLKDFYYNASRYNSVEVVYISADRSLIEFKDVYASMPFLAMPAGSTSYKNELTKLLKITGMPALVVLDEEGNVVSVQGVKKISDLEKGNIEQANALVERWKKTRPIPMEQVKQDMTLLHGQIERGTVYWT
jgi:Thioredoxin-like